MIKANLRLVVKIARDYEGIGLPLLDLISEGNIGLMKAVERFDPAKGGKLSTYGSWWIKQSIKRALANQSKTIRLPVHLVDKISKMRRTAMKLQEELGREPTDEELADELGITAARVAQMRMAAIRPASLDAPIGDDDSTIFPRSSRTKRRHALRATRRTRPSPACCRTWSRHLDDARGDHSALPFRPRRRHGKNAGGSRREIRRHPRARPPDPEHRPAQAAQDDRKTGKSLQTQGTEPCPCPEPPPQEIERAIRNVPDFPKPGIQFKDITPVLADARLFRRQRLTCSRKNFKPGSVDAVVGIDARGFIFAAAAAVKLQAGFVPVRKKGKLPLPDHRAGLRAGIRHATVAIDLRPVQLDGLRQFLHDRKGPR
jgi:hypothetical protein